MQLSSAVWRPFSKAVLRYRSPECTKSHKYTHLSQSVDFLSFFFHILFCVF